MFQVHSFAPGFLLGLVTAAVLAVKPAAEPETGPTDEAAGELAAIPASQEDVDSVAVITNSTSLVNIPNSVVTINNGSSSRKVVVTFSAEIIFMDDGDSSMLGFRIDGGSCVFGGPQIFSRGTFATDTHTVVHVFTIGTGTHTIRPCWAVIPDGDGAQFISVGRRSLVAEGRTQ
jgi:hypothetical protein